MRKIILITVTIFSSLFIQAQSNVDSLKQLLTTPLQDSTRLVVLNDLIAQIIWNTPQEGLRYAQQYDSIAQQTDRLSWMAHGQKLMGMCEYVNEHYEVAVTYYLKALASYEQLNDTINIAYLYNNIGAAYSVREKQHQTIKYYQKAHDNFRLIGDKEWQAITLQNIGVQYVQLAQLDSALLYYLPALELFERADDNYQPLEASRLSGILGNIAFVFAEMNQPDKAIRYGLRALKFSDPEVNAGIHGQILSSLGRAYEQQQNATLTEQYFLESVAFASKNNDLKQLEACLELLSNFYAKQKEYENAYQYQAQMIGIRDTLFSRDQDKQMSELLTKYETKQKEVEIERLALEEQLNKAQIKNQRFIIIGLILGFGLLVMLLYYLFNQRKKIESQNIIISKALAEKETLLKEIHHRVKNNLQVISSLLSLQSLQIKDPIAQQAMQEGRNRVKSMALIHQNLYQDENLVGVSTSEYIKKLTDSLVKNYNINQENIQVLTDVDDLKLDVDTIIPLGLILNELISNALKHAFVDKQSRIIEIQLKQDGTRLKLKVADNGKGLPQTFAIESNDSLGFNLIKSFADKLKAELKVMSEQSGTIVQLMIPNFKMA